MAELVVMPKLGLTMTEGTVSNWRKAEGESVTVGEVLFDVETDKLTNEIEASASGVLRKIFVQEGVVGVLKPLAIIGGADEDISGLLGGEPAAEEPKAEEQAPKAAGAAPANNTSVGGNTGRVKASPRAKKLAQELNVDLSLVTGTGPQGTISEKDIQAYVDNHKGSGVKASPMAEKAAKALDVDMSKIDKDGRIMKEDVLQYRKDQDFIGLVDPREDRKPMSAMRKVISKRMLESKQISPTVTYNLKVDTTNLSGFRNQLKTAYKVTYTDLIVKIVAKALLEFPLLNCSIDNNELIFRNYASVGVAVALDDGLIVPVVKYANKKDLKEISKEIKELAFKARNNELKPQDMAGGTFTITNLGMYGMESFTPIINQPEVAILGVNAIIDTPVAINGQVVIKPLMNLSLTADHRAVDGSVAAQFMAKVKEYIENPALLLL
ncbi:dihydrolipoamide acetyltransferase family protein [Petroclostridium sp. X23]|uniref:dihydrolipoamide acetyltransferase family protein n=1 Tax=Petroclostridium sp. X23 TaxID=3045146 RepID=UPI0024AE1B6B|nr:dihydrolipoamide acetyltransferase family protein [Petroclostridium sp. X23]WHH57035.1 dihydrolipoamide acetyltransferase family protein [Petroclostridium sp. X23]